MTETLGESHDTDPGGHALAASDDLLLGVSELAEAAPEYTRAWQYFRGEAGEHFSSPVVARRMAQSDGLYRINVAQMPVVALQSRIAVASVTLLGPGGEKDEARDGEFQDRVVMANQMDLLWKRVIRGVLALGDSYMFVWHGDTEGSVTCAYNDPRTTRIVYDPEDDRKILFMVRRWQARDGVRASVYYADRFELGWRLKPDMKEDTPAAWERVPYPGQPERDLEPANDTGRVPGFHFRNDLPHGRPAHEGAFGPQDAISKISPTMAATTEASGLPERWALTESGASLNGDSADAPDWDDDADAGPENRDNSRLRSGPGEIALLQGIREVGEWTAAQPAAFTDAADWYLQMLAVTTGVPMHYLDHRGDAPSGEALRVADAPLNALAKDIRDYLDPEARASQTYAAHLLGFEDATVDVRWVPTGIVDDLATWQLVQLKIASGMPQRVAIHSTGLHEQTEIDSWFDDQNVEMDVARRIGLISQLAGAVQQLGQGVALGLLDEALARGFVESTLGQITPDVEEQPA